MTRILIVMLCGLLGGCAIAPAPLTVEEISTYASDKRARVTAGQEPITRSIDMYDAMARALKYNLDHQVEIRAVALKQRQLNLAHYSMLPELTASTGYADRSNYSGGFSRELTGPDSVGNQSLRSSTSSDKDVRVADIAFTWHVLDFGLSYVRARQSADHVLVAEEQRRKVVNKLIEDVRSAYWRAISAERMLRKLHSLEHRVAFALRNSRRLSDSGQTAPLTALTYQRELVEIKREIQTLEGNLRVAKMQLSALMNLEPGTRYVLRTTDHGRPFRFSMTARSMIDAALLNRSEMREVAYQARINSREVEAALLEMLPGMQLYAGPKWDSNEFLFNSNWNAWGAKAAWNLLKVFSYPARRREIDAQADLLDARALAVTMAIMTQVHVSRVRHRHALRQYRTARQYHGIQRRILRQISEASRAGNTSEQTLIREEMNTLVAKVKQDIAYAELQNAYANAFASVGLDPFGDLLQGDESVQEIAQILRQSWDQLTRQAQYQASYLPAK